ncbi:hypothetical protein L1987_56314 [Smallanthus sonchifolius]|uniref:Uncharacterized protein n=1 Tax=Smallanthus sonchifolius TaxID=185202 RepID=A0ACB9ED41_9ASTR|nr:hypothetical protein L1987_56314 [Smallanthus sonchifolius]
MKLKLLESTLGLIEIFWNSRSTKSSARLSLSPGSHCMFLLVCFYLIGLQGKLLISFCSKTKLISQSFNGEKWEKFHSEIVPSFKVAAQQEAAAGKAMEQHYAAQVVV